MTPRAAITAVFFVNGALFASWASRIPALSDRAGATTGALGLALLAPAASPWGYDSLDWRHLAQPPGLTAAHWFGTDRLGRDLFVRTLHGVRLSLLISLLASAISVGIGLAWGTLAGFAGGRTEEAMMRFVDVLYSLPYLFVVIILTKTGTVVNFAGVYTYLRANPM